MKSTEYQKQQLEQDIQRYSQVSDAQGQPSLTLKDAMFIREIEDAKLARWYLTSMYEENRRKAVKDSERLQQQNADVQMKSNQQNADNEAKAQQVKVQSEKDMVMYKSTQDKELALLTGYMAAIGKGVVSADTIMPVIQQLMPNLSIPLKIENNHLAELSQQQDITKEQAIAQAQQEQENPDEQQPQQQMQSQQSPSLVMQ